jgi:dolichol-phosphate mannosyltransferase
MTIIVVLPIYNEGMNLIPLFEAISATFQQNNLSYRVIAVDDGSRDESSVTLEELEVKYPIQIITHSINRGLGETIRDGFELAARLAFPGDIIIRFDADCTHEPKYIPSLIDAIQNGADVAIASRFAPGGGQEGLNTHRRWISQMANVFFRICFPISRIKEYTCGYRAYRASLIQDAISFYGGNFIQLRGLGFCCTVEKLLKLQLLGAKFVEVPFVLRYDFKQSASKMAFNVTTIGYILMVLLYHWPWGGWKTTVAQKREQRFD